MEPPLSVLLWNNLNHLFVQKDPLFLQIRNAASSCKKKFASLSSLLGPVSVPVHPPWQDAHVTPDPALRGDWPMGKPCRKGWDGRAVSECAIVSQLATGSWKFLKSGNRSLHYEFSMRRSSSRGEVSPNSQDQHRPLLTVNTLHRHSQTFSRRHLGDSWDIWRGIMLRWPHVVIGCAINCGGELPTVTASPAQW